MSCGKARTQNSLTRVVLFDPYVGGHHSSYVHSLSKFWHEHRPSGSLCIVVSPEFIEDYPDIVEEINGYGRGIRLVPIAPSDYAVLDSPKSPVLRSIGQWKVLSKYTRQLDGTHCVALYLDSLLPALALGTRSHCRFDLSGIYFRPSFHYENFEKNTPDCKERLKRWGKKRLLWFALRHPCLKVLFSLDPLAVRHIESLNSKVRVLHLPNPMMIYDGLPNTQSQLWESFGAEAGRKVFLTFGVLKRKKGIYELLNAVKVLPPTLAERICLLFVGSVAKDEKDLFAVRVAQVRKMLPVQIVVHDEFIPAEEIQPIFRMADVILTLYPSHVGMSGILVRAAAAGKPVLASQYGLVGELVRRNSLGLTVDASRPKEIALGLQRMLSEGTELCDYSKMRAFAESNTSEDFARTIFNNLE